MRLLDSEVLPDALENVKSEEAFRAAMQRYAPQGLKELLRHFPSSQHEFITELYRMCTGRQR